MPKTARIELIELVATIFHPAVNFVDDATHYTTLAFMALKSQTAETFIRFKNSAETLHERNMKTLRTDGGFHYYQFDQLYTSGLRHETTTPYTPQSNGVAERSWGVLVPTARAMMLATNAPAQLWPEAMRAAAYLRNRLPTKGRIKTPYELWFGKPPTFNHLRVWGCRAFVHIPKELHEGKFQPAAWVGAMVGYSETSKAWRIYNAETQIPNRATSRKYSRLVTCHRDAVRSWPA